LSSKPFPISGLESNPFSTAIDEKGYYHTEANGLIAEELLHGIESRRGFLLLVGERGVGKTSLLLQLLPVLKREKVATSVVLETLTAREDLLPAIAREFGLTIPPSFTLSNVFAVLQQYILDRNAAGKNCVIVVDEAHNLKASALEALRMLAGIKETGGGNAVQILLVGQPEILDRLDQPRLRRLRGLIGTFRKLPPLSRSEVKSYVTFMPANAGARLRPSRTAFCLLWMTTRGNIRLIDLIMERTLHTLAGDSRQKLTARIMLDALKDISSGQVEVARRLRTIRLKLLALACVFILLVAAACAAAIFLPSLLSSHGL